MSRFKRVSSLEKFDFETKLSQIEDRSWKTSKRGIIVVSNREVIVHTTYLPIDGQANA